MLVAAGAAPPFLRDVVVLVAGAAAIAYLCHRLRQAPIIGFLIAGVGLGPYGLGLVDNMMMVESAAEIGVLLLLFGIGIEFSLGKLMAIKRTVLVGGGIQVIGTVAVVTALLSALGVEPRTAIFTGCLVSLSSTAIVLKLLSDRGETGTAHGQVALGVLIFQDLAVLVMVMLLPVLGGQGDRGDALLAIAKALVLVVVVVVVARRIMPKLLEAVARTCSNEVFLLTVLAICLGTAWLFSLAGVSLSLGAFLAGLLVSESAFSEHALGEVLPLEILFSAVFFVSVGMLLDLSYLMANLGLVLGIVIGVVVLKTVVTAIGALSLGRSLTFAAGAGLMLCQVGEFSFVLQRAGREVGLVPGGLGDGGEQAFIAAAVLLMLMTPAGFAIGRRSTLRSAEPRMAGESEPVAIVERGHVVIAGYGAQARRLVPVLAAEGYPTVILTLSPEGAREAEAAGLEVVRADYRRHRTLAEANLADARVVVVADDDFGRAESVVKVVRQSAPEVTIVSRARRAAEAEALEVAGADVVIAEETEAAAALSEQVLVELGASPAAIGKALIGLRGAKESSDEGPSPPATLRARYELTSEERASNACRHTGNARAVAPLSPGCAECLAEGGRWVHLRVCLECGHVGCCDSSPHRHARAHFEATGHGLIKSAEPGEDWAWCFLDNRLL